MVNKKTSGYAVVGKNGGSRAIFFSLWHAKSYAEWRGIKNKIVSVYVVIDKNNIIVRELSTRIIKLTASKKRS